MSFEFKPQTIISFSYFKDNAESTDRLVYVEQVLTDVIKCWDLHKQGYRNFTKDHILNPRLVNYNLWGGDLQSTANDIRKLLLDSKSPELAKETLINCLYQETKNRLYNLPNSYVAEILPTVQCEIPIKFSLDKDFEFSYGDYRLVYKNKQLSVYTVNKYNNMVFSDKTISNPTQKEFESLIKKYLV